jgi:hypothetical protein
MQRRDQTGSNCEHMWFVLASETKNDEARMSLRCIRSDVRKASIERYKNSILGIADVSDSGIVQAAKLLFDDARCIPAGLTKKLDQFLRKILVYLEPHVELRRQGQNFFTNYIGSIGDARLDGLVRKTWVAVENLRLGNSRREIVEDHGNGNPGRGDACLSVANVWVDGNVMMPIHG